MSDTEPGEFPELVVRLFGPLDVRLPGGQRAPPPRTRKGASLLVLLVLRAGRPVQRSWLAGTLWPESPEPQALYNLRRSLSDLRRILGPDGGRITSPTLHTVCLDLSGAVSVDVLAFDAAVKSGDTASLEAAARLYRGALLEGWLEEWVVPEREARRQACVCALEQLAGHALNGQDYTLAAERLRRLLHLDPLQESAWRMLMQALASSGEYAAAVQCYRELRELLRRELNSDAAVETRALFQEIRQAARSAAAPPSAVKLILAAPRRGLLPRPLTRFVGREVEVRELEERLDSARLITLVGTGGVGKTRLALRVAEEVADSSPDGTWFVDLGSLADPCLVPNAVASILGIRGEPTPSPPGRMAAVLVEFLCPRRLLLILDGCERVVAACGDLVAMLLHECPGARILATSRQRLGVDGEAVWRVPALSAPDLRRMGQLTPDAQSLLEQYEAVRLFVDRAQLHNRSFEYSGHTSRAVAHICALLEGIPLAIELAAARTSVLGVEQIADRLKNRLSLLVGESRSAAARHQTLRAAFDWSHDLLAEPERLLLRRLSIFVGGWTLEAAEAVCSEPAERGHGAADSPDVDTTHLLIQRHEVLNLLTGLVDKSLALVQEHDGLTRYRLLDCTRHYALEKLEVSGDAGRTRQRHFAWFLELAESTPADDAERLDDLDRELDNFRDALAWTLPGSGGGPVANLAGPGTAGSSSDRTLSALRLMVALRWYWMVRGHITEGRSWLARALVQSSQVPRTAKLDAVRAVALNAAAVLAAIQGEHDAARSYYEQSLAIHQELSDAKGAAHVLHNLGNLASDGGDYARARHLYEEALAIMEETGDRSAAALALGSLAVLAQSEGEYPRARQLHQQSLALKRELGDRLGVAATLNNLGNLLRIQGDFAAARSLLEDSAGLFRELGDRRGLAHALDTLGRLHRAQGEFDVANALHCETLGPFQEMGNTQGIAYALEGLAAIAVRQGEPERAAVLWGAAERLRTTSGTALTPLDHTEMDSDIAAARGQLGEESFQAARTRGALLTLEEAIDIAQRRQTQAVPHALRMAS